MKTILIPTDFSENSWNAIKYAFSLFGDEGCHFILLNGYYVPDTGAGMALSGYEEAVRKASEENLVDQKKRLKGKFPNAKYTIETIATYGAPSISVNQIVEDKKIDLIVMGTTGSSGIREILIGNNTKKVIRNTDTPVLVVPNESRFTKIDRIAYATDYKEIKEKSVLYPLLEIASKYNSDVFIVNVTKKEGELVTVKEATEGVVLHHFLEGVNHTYFEATAHNTEEGILNFANEKQANLLVLIERDYGFFERLFHHSVIKQMVFHSDVPTLVLPNK